MPSEDEVQMRNLRVLVVDDDPDFAESMAVVLELGGHQVETAQSGEEAIEKFLRQDYDVAFMDVRLPRQNGVEALNRIREAKPEARVVMMTGYSVKELMDKALKDGAWAILHKPFDMERVLELVGRIKPVAILVADDDQDFLSSVKELLEWNGYRVYAAHTAQQTIERLRAGGVDLAILDLRLPDGSGLDVCRELRGSGSLAPALIFTGYAKEEAQAIQKLQSLSNASVIVKPFPMRTLLQSVEQLTA